MKRIVQIVIVCILLVGIAFADSIYVLCSPEDMLNVRVNPSIRSEAIGGLYCGDSVETDGKIRKDKWGNKWIHIINIPCEVDEAWISTTYIQDTPVVVNEAIAVVTARGRRTAIRRSPNGKVIKWAKRGDELVVVAYSQEWVLTTKGYIKADCVEIN